MKKKLLVVVLAVASMLCMVFALSACDLGGNGGASLPNLPKEGYSEEGLYFSLNADGRSYAVERGNWSGTNLVIPSLFNGAPVTSIGWHAFAGCEGLTEITIPESLTSIEEAAFDGCSGLKKVHVTDLATWCNISFLRLNSITPLYSNPLYYAHHLYMDGEEITKLEIPDSVVTIGEYVFSGCSGLTEITIPDSVTSIGEYAFGECSALTEVTIPDSVTSIGQGAFAYCSRLTEVTIPDSVTSIGEYAFWNCSELTEITIPDSVTSIGNFAFFLCTGLTSVTLGSSVTTIGEYAFSGCDKLTEVTIPDSVTEIGKTAFYNCSGLTEVTIGNGVTSIGIHAFKACRKLKKVYFQEPNEWKVSGNYDMSDATAVTGLNDPVTAARYLTDTYCDDSWKR